MGELESRVLGETLGIHSMRTCSGKLPKVCAFLWLRRRKRKKKSGAIFCFLLFFFFCGSDLSGYYWVECGGTVRIFAIMAFWT